jgi:hypothetical protein
MRRLLPLVCFTCLWCFSGVACGPSVASLKSRKSEVSSLKKKIRAAEANQRAAKRYTAALKSGEHAWFAIGKTGLHRVMKDFLPYKFKGKHLSKKRLKGDFAFTTPSKISLHSGNRIRYRVKFQAKKVSVNLKGIFGASKSDGRKIKQALEGGGTLDIEIKAYIDGKKQNVILMGNCYRVKLNKQNTSSHRDYLRDGINSKFFKFGRRLPLPSSLKSIKPTLLTTSNQIVIIGSK